MKPGVWRARPAQPARTRAIVGRSDVINPLTAELATCTVTHQAIGGDFFAKSGSMQATGDGSGIGNRSGRTVTTPWFPNSTLPRAGDPAKIRVDDGSGQVWTLIDGVVDKVPGTMNSTAVNLTVADPTVDELSRRVTLDPRAWSAPPLFDNGAFRHFGLMVESLIDALGVQIGYAATPYATSAFGSTETNTLLRVPFLGSAEQTHGTCRFSARADNNDLVPLIDLSSPTGRVVAANLYCNYELTAATSDVDVIWDIAVQRGAYVSGWAQVLVHDDTDQLDGLFLHQEGSTIQVRVRQGGSTTATLFTAGVKESSRVTMRITAGSGGLKNATLIVDGATIATTTVSLPNWQARACRVQGPGRCGAVLVARANSSIVEPRINIRTQFGDYLDVSPAIDRNFLDWLSEVANATGADVWIDAAGTLQWAARGWLDKYGPISGLEFSGGNLDDIAWTEDLGEFRSQVTMRGKSPAITRRNWAGITLWQQSSPTNIRAGDQEEIWIAPPNMDESWLYIDRDWSWVTAAQQSDWFHGNRIGGTYIFPGGGSNPDQEQLATSSTLGISTEWVESQTCKVSYSTPGSPGANYQLETRTPTVFRESAKSLPLLRGRGRALWSDAAETRRIGSVGPSDEVDVAYWVHRPATVDRWWTDVVAMGSRATPTIGGVSVSYDPRVELGDKVTISDPLRTGLRFELVVLSISAEPTSDRMTLGGRPVGVTFSRSITDQTTPPWAELAARWGLITTSTGGAA